MAKDHAEHDHDCNDCSDECGTVVLERPRYYTGRYLTARDFTLEQDYFRSRAHLHNRALHGWGVVCGLGVSRHSRPKDCPDWVVVHAGLAIDCCGREIILEKDTALQLDLPRPERGPPFQQQPQETYESNASPDHDSGGDSPDESSPDQESQYGGEPPDSKQGYPDRPPEQRPDYGERPLERMWVVVRYTEECTECVPALYESGAECCDPNHREANRIREVAHLEVMHHLPPGCWSNAHGHEDTPVREDCEEQPSACLTPDCVCDGYIPLAEISYDPADPTDFEIDTRGRRQVLVPGDFLTHVAHINWPHGGEMTLGELARLGNLEVSFDRQLQGWRKKPDGSPVDAPRPGTGVSSFTFVVQYGGVQRSIEFLPPDKAPEVVDGHKAVFTIDPRYLNERDHSTGTVVNNDIYISLKCDFILDCLGNAVDGNFKRAALPSGNGTEGGTFESWFTVIPDRDRY